jgi:hypothetical protein
LEGRRVSLLGGVKSGLGGVRTSGESSGGGGGAGTVESISSPDGSIVVTNPTGPDVELEVNASAFPAVLFDMFLSYGHGMDVDANLPAATSFWLTPTTLADLARADQVREWEVDHALSSLRLVVVVSESAGIGLGLPVIVTVDGVDIALSVLLPDGVSGDTSYEAFLVLDVPSGSFIGVRVDGSALGAAASVRMQVRLIGLGDGGGGAGIPFVTHDFTLQGDGTALNPLGTKIRTLGGTNGVDITSSSGNYTARGSYLPTFGGGLIYEDVPGVGRRFDSGTQLVATDFINLLNLNEQQDFVWAAISSTFQQQGSPALITAAWIAIEQEILGNVTTAPEVTLFLADGTFVTSTGQITADGSKFQFPVTSDLFLIPVSPPPTCNTNIAIEFMAPGVFGGTGMYAKVTKAGVVTGGPLTAKIIVQITLNQGGTP